MGEKEGEKAQGTDGCSPCDEREMGDYEEWVTYSLRLLIALPEEYFMEDTCVWNKISLDNEV